MTSSGSCELPRRATRPVWVGGVQVGGGAPVVVQSMTKTPTADVAATLSQIEELAAEGCEIVRVAVPDREAAEALKEIRRRSPLPLVADIHFDYRLALAALEAGVDGLRLNPGNIGGRERVRAVVAAARERGVPIRVGVNAASLEKGLLAKYGGPTPEALVESALDHIRLLEDMDFSLIKVSVKSSHVPTMLAAYRLLAARVDYPFHVGVTEAGPLKTGSLRSAVGIGALLAEGLGDTVRVSLTAHPKHEVRVAFEILKALGLRRRGAELISCPTCARCTVDLEPVAAAVEGRLEGLEVPLRVAVMGCAVNGPGEAREADVGVAVAAGSGLIFRRGRVVRRVPGHAILEELWREIDRLREERA
ncbi:MAG: flavodoxin-dependent (E)-4-hydroxy-3-methylbut-2-enyl-diphosphate synthase [Firmicutes bacterium]|nr:flavodoxin-dependent (E)-4-hydroxy-3-methylbut-2-enyl-diphosphate synthase [Bacillota bacterium]